MLRHHATVRAGCSSWELYLCVDTNATTVPKRGLEAEFVAAGEGSTREQSLCAIGCNHKLCELVPRSCWEKFGIFLTLNLGLLGPAKAASIDLYVVAHHSDALLLHICGVLFIFL
jgi:hypothetical protein